MDIVRRTLPNEAAGRGPSQSANLDIPGGDHAHQAITDLLHRVSRIRELVPALFLLPYEGLPCCRRPCLRLTSGGALIAFLMAKS